VIIGLEPQVRQQYAAVAAEVNPLRRCMQSRNPQNSSAEPMSLPDRIERIGRALTADELASMLTVSRITILKQAKLAGFRHSASALVYGLTRRRSHNGCERCDVSGDSSPRSGIRPKNADASLFRTLLSSVYNNFNGCRGTAKHWKIRTRRKDHG
jgi:hypothetical protein